jgi:dihydroorotate dehydrogenase
MYSFLRPLLFTLSPTQAHHAGMSALQFAELFAPGRSVMSAMLATRDPRLEVKKMGLTFANPIGIAGGFDKDGRCPRALAALGFGFVELGTVTAIAQAANPAPNLFRLPADKALINRLGFPNLGAAALARRMADVKLDVPVGISIGKSRVVDVENTDAVVNDYLESLRTVAPVSDFVVINVSSPNTANLRAMQRAESAQALLSRLRDDSSATRRPLLLKIAPDLDDEALEALLDVVKRIGLDGVIATNTTVSREGLATPNDIVSSLGAGGLSGPPLRERALRFVTKARQALGPAATVVGVGGISTVEHVRAFVDAGADLCQLYTAFIYEGPSLPGRLCRGLLGPEAS